MTISWYGEACFLLEAGGIRILIEPPEKESGINPPRLKSDILIYSKPRKEKKIFADEETAAFIIDSPGEYEIKGINILGINDSSMDSASLPKTNTLYSIEMDDVKIVHLGFLNKDLDNEKLELLDDPNIVLVPAGGIKEELLDAERAMKLINKMEPNIAIPMLYDIKELKIKRAPLSAFLKESGVKDSPQPKLVIKKKDLAEEETKIVILEYV